MSTATVDQDPAETGSIFQSNLPLEAKLERARTDLLDLSARNRLLNMPRSAKSARILQAIDADAAQIFRVLVREGRSMSFLPGRLPEDETKAAVDEETGEIAEIAQPEEDTAEELGTSSRRADNKLQPRLTPAGLQKRLLDLYHDARTLEEEQDVNILYLALRGRHGCRRRH